LTGVLQEILPTALPLMTCLSGIPTKDCVGKGRRQPCRDTLSRQGFAPQEALGEGYAQTAKFGKLVLGFHPFRYHPEVQASGHAEDEFDNGRAVRVGSEFFNEGAVYFQRPG
jgi:hypothetical protein